MRKHFLAVNLRYSRNSNAVRSEILMGNAQKQLKELEMNRSSKIIRGFRKFKVR